MDFYLGILVKLIVTVVLLMVYVKISGKSQLAPMTAFDQIGNMVVGAIGGSTLLNTNISTLDCAVFLTIWILFLLFIRFLRARYEKVKTLIDGKRLQLVKNGTVITENFKKASLSISSMEVLLHRDGLNGLYEVKNIWFEPNGQLTIDKKGDDNKSVILIDNGTVNSQGLKDLEKDDRWLQAMLKRNPTSLRKPSSARNGCRTSYGYIHLSMKTAMSSNPDIAGVFQPNHSTSPVLLANMAFTRPLFWAHIMTATMAHVANTITILIFIPPVLPPPSLHSPVTISIH